MDGLQLFLDMEVSLAAVVPHKDAALALAADLLADKAGMSYEQARDALSAREQLGSTVLGHGAAMSHAMSPNCLYPAAVLMGLAAPLDFDAPDGRGVDVVFALIWPKDRAREFLELSSTISRVLADPAILKLVRRSAAPELIRRSIHLNAQFDRTRTRLAPSGRLENESVVRIDI